MYDNDIKGLLIMHCDTAPTIVRMRRVYNSEGMAFITFATPKEADMVVRNIKQRWNTRDDSRPIEATHAWYKERYHKNEMVPIPAYRPEQPPSPSVFGPPPQVAQAAKEVVREGPRPGEVEAPITVAESVKARSESSNRTKVPVEKSIPPWRDPENRRRRDSRSRSRRPRSGSVRTSSRGGNKKIDFDDGRTKFSFKWKDTPSASRSGGRRKTAGDKHKGKQANKKDKA
jgi:hypothetical protein